MEEGTWDKGTKQDKERTEEGDKIPKGELRWDTGEMMLCSESEPKIGRENVGIILNQ